MSVTFDFEIANYLYKMARIHEILLNEKYSARAYFSAAMAIDSCDTYVKKMYTAKKLCEISHIGIKIEKCIIEIIETGRLKELNDLENNFKIKDYTLLQAHGLPANLIKKLWDMSINSADTLCSEYKNISECDFKKGEQKKIAQFIDNYKNQKGYYLYAYGERLGCEVISHLKNISGITYVDFYKNQSPSKKIQVIEIAICFNGSKNDLINILKNYSRINIFDANDNCITGETAFGIPIRISFLESVPNRDAKNNNSLGINIFGDLHIHTNYSDGIHSIEKMVNTAKDLGHDYIAITDHSFSMRMAHGLSANDLLSEISEIKEIATKSNFHILAGIEVDILRDGKLDYEDEILSQLDFVVAAIHTNIDLPSYQMEDRLKIALKNPYVNVLAHPTTRLLGRPGEIFCERNPFSLNVDKIIEICKENDVALELNCFPERMDLDEDAALLALKQGVTLSIGSDSHSLAHLCNIKYGVEILKKLPYDDIKLLNKLKYEDLLNFLKTQRDKKLKKIENNTPLITYSNNIHDIKKDFYYYFNENKNIINGESKVIGIDLTGSEEKESGWALLKGPVTKCRRIKTDSELIQSIKDASPDIVSIDSPLAKPFNGGIMRESELLLRHFGVYVYPCMIDSMVSLTTRGSKLAKVLRDMGYKVIESYPGVAQDVLLIPRKGKTSDQAEHLKKGICNFGITGDVVDKIEISHDELDAVTCALVGYFYMIGQYVALGNDHEDYLIVPRFFKNRSGKKIIIGLAGETGSGKTTSAWYLKFKYGFETFRYSQVISKKYNVTGKENLEEIGSQIALNTNEQRALSEYLIKMIKNGWANGQSFVIDGLRHYEDFATISNEYGSNFILLYIESSYTNRQKRFCKQNKGVTKNDFEKINNHSSEKDIPLLAMKTTHIIDNNGGFSNLRRQLDSLVESIIRS